MLSDRDWAAINELEEHSRFPTGVGKIERGKCECGALTPMACMFCPYGHMLECHYPSTCEEAQCSHWEQEIAAEAYLEGETEEQPRK